MILFQRNKRIASLLFFLVTQKIIFILKLTFIFSFFQEYIEEALVIRGKRTLSAKHEEIPQEKFTKPLSHYTYVCDNFFKF